MSKGKDRRLGVINSLSTLFGFSVTGFVPAECQKNYGKKFGSKKKCSSKRTSRSTKR